MPSVVRINRGSSGPSGLLSLPTFRHRAAKTRYVQPHLVGKIIAPITRPFIPVQFASFPIYYRAATIPKLVSLMCHFRM